VACTLVLGLLSACGSSPAPPKPAAAATKPDRSLSAAAVSYNDTARFLAGLPGRAESSVAPLEKTPEWQAYARGFDETWTAFDKNQGEPMRAFEQKELAPVKPKGAFVFYPFSGPDVLYMMGFFPGRGTYVMVGLEPAGTLPAPESFKPADMANEVKAWTTGVRSIFKRSFFVTSEMDAQFRGRVADGLLEPICLLLARSGYVIESIRHGNLNEEGVFAEANMAALPLNAKGKPIKPMGVEVAFRRGVDGETQKLYYFSKSLDQEFKTKPGFSRFLLALGQPDTMIKSAQFIMHWPGMSDLRNQILETSRTILQDDTGVPFKYLKPPQWEVRLFGKYSAPDKPFKTWYQKDLAKAFDDPAKVTPLGMQIGYGAWRRPSSLILAVRNSTVVTASAAQTSAH
jgi:hypothetical protein